MGCETASPEERSYLKKKKTSSGAALAVHDKMTLLLWPLLLAFGSAVIVTAWLLLVVHNDDPRVLQSIIFPERPLQPSGRRASSTVLSAAQMAEGVARKATIWTDSSDQPEAPQLGLHAAREKIDTSTELANFMLPPYAFATARPSSVPMESIKMLKTTASQTQTICSSPTDWSVSRLQSHRPFTDRTPSSLPAGDEAAGCVGTAGAYAAGDSADLRSSYERAVRQLQGDLESTEQECEALRQNIDFIYSMRQKLHRESAAGLTFGAQSSGPCGVVGGGGSLHDGSVN